MANRSNADSNDDSRATQEGCRRSEYLSAARVVGCLSRRDKKHNRRAHGSLAHTITPPPQLASASRSLFAKAYSRTITTPHQRSSTTVVSSMTVIASDDFPMTLIVHVINSSGLYDLWSVVGGGESGDLTVM